MGGPRGFAAISAAAMPAVDWLTAICRQVDWQPAPAGCCLRLTSSIQACRHCPSPRPCRRLHRSNVRRFRVGQCGMRVTTDVNPGTLTPASHGGPLHVRLQSSQQTSECGNIGGHVSPAHGRTLQQMIIDRYATAAGDNAKKVNRAQVGWEAQAGRVQSEAEAGTWVLQDGLQQLGAAQGIGERQVPLGRLLCAVDELHWPFAVVVHFPLRNRRYAGKKVRSWGSKPETNVQESQAVQVSQTTSFPAADSANPIAGIPESKTGDEHSKAHKQKTITLLSASVRRSDTITKLLHALIIGQREGRQHPPN